MWEEGEWGEQHELSSWLVRRPTWSGRERDQTRESGRQVERVSPEQTSKPSYLVSVSTHSNPTIQQQQQQPLMTSEEAQAQAVSQQQSAKLDSDVVVPEAVAAQSNNEQEAAPTAATDEATPVVKAADDAHPDVADGGKAPTQAQKPPASPSKKVHRRNIAIEEMQSRGEWRTAGRIASASLYADRHSVPYARRRNRKPQTRS